MPTRDKIGLTEYLLLEVGFGSFFGDVTACISGRAGIGNGTVSRLSLGITKLAESACSTAVSHLVVPKPTPVDVGKVILLPTRFLHPVQIPIPVEFLFPGLRRNFGHTPYL